MTLVCAKEGWRLVTYGSCGGEVESGREERGKVKSRVAGELYVGDRVLTRAGQCSPKSGLEWGS